MTTLLLSAPAAPLLLPALTPSTRARNAALCRMLTDRATAAREAEESARQAALLKAWHARSANAADPIPAHGAFDCWGQKPRLGPDPFVNTFCHKDADSCFGEPPSKRLLLIAKVGPGFTIPANTNAFMMNVAKSNTAATVGKTSAGRAAYQR